ncbi:hypothetical protein FRB95_008392 [Tulasnella sp. JGI-2019a]|nr:hypothetical protein FRB95_008392 [Tulasnella sp. JGI-2019a]
MNQQALLANLQHALHQYQEKKKDALIQAICQIPNGLSDKEMSEALQHLILQHGQFSTGIKPQAL